MNTTSIGEAVETFEIENLTVQGLFFKNLLTKFSDLAILRLAVITPQ